MASTNSDSAILVSRTVKALRDQVTRWNGEGRTVALVPTMGALHQGHLSLIDLARQKADRVVASIFVNPSQFAPHEDLATYPRREDEDIRKLANAGCDLAYCPSPEEVYPAGFKTEIRVSALADALCGISRPHFFGGVATVVCKLLNQCRPHVAIFGEKDFQQLLIIRRMVRDLDMSVDIVGAPIIREPDGLAMSSRNAYLSDQDRVIAGKLNVIMQNAIQEFQSGARIDETINAAAQSLAEAGFTDVDYLEVRSAESLRRLGPERLSLEEPEPARLFAAAMLGRTRLIDNMAIPKKPPVQSA